MSWIQMNSKRGFDINWMNSIKFKIFTPVMVLENMTPKTQLTPPGIGDSDNEW